MHNSIIFKTFCLSVYLVHATNPKPHKGPYSKYIGTFTLEGSRRQVADRRRVYTLVAARQVNCVMTFQDGLCTTCRAVQDVFYAIMWLLTSSKLS